MRDRVFFRKFVVLKVVGDVNYVLVYMDLKNILGISRLDFESGSDIFMFILVEKSGRGNERKNLILYEGKSNYGLI